MMPPAANPASSHQILVVDDEEIVLVALRETLARHGYRVIATSHPLDAVERLRRETFAVILTDHQMPEMTGLELLAQAREQQPDSTRILITAVLNLTTVIDSINKGEVYRFIIKPWMREDLLVAVGNAVQRYELIVANHVLQSSLASLNERLGGANVALTQRLGEATRTNERLAATCHALGQDLSRALELGLRVAETSCPAMVRRTRRVPPLCRAMAARLSLADDQQRTLEVAAWLHDIGLVRLPPDLVSQWEQTPETLTDSQRALIERHPVLSQELASFTGPLQAVGEVIRAHHERLDGRGYPDGLAGEAIPWLGRLLAVVVAFVAAPEESPAALDELHRGAGTRFDPRAVDALASVGSDLK